MSYLKTYQKKKKKKENSRHTVVSDNQLWMENFGSIFCHSINAFFSKKFKPMSF